MDLVAGVRKEGSRGGRDSFKWSDVKDSQHRENYLGHSLMAPVGRWQKNRDLSWYAKGEEGEAAEQSAKDERREEIRRIKEAEQEALAKALGFAPNPKPLGSGTEANSVPVSGKEVEKAVQEATGGDDDQDGGKGVGYGIHGGSNRKLDQDEVLAGSGSVGGGIMVKQARREERSRSRTREKRRRSRSRDKGKERERHCRRHEHGDKGHRKRSSISRERGSERRRRSRSRSRARWRHEQGPPRKRSYSPERYESRRDHNDRYEYRERRR